MSKIAKKGVVEKGVAEQNQFVNSSARTGQNWVTFNCLLCFQSSLLIGNQLWENGNEMA